MAKAPKFGTDADFAKHVGQPAHIAHQGKDSFFVKGGFITYSAGAGDVGKPIKLGAGGKIDSSMVSSGTPSAHAASHEIGGGDLVDHDNLTNFVANEHINWTNTTEDFSTAGSVGCGVLVVIGQVDDGIIRVHSLLAGGNHDAYVQFYEASVSRGYIKWDGGDNDFIWVSTVGDIRVKPKETFKIEDDASADYISFQHTGSNAYVRWSGGIFNLQTDEGFDTNTYVHILGKGAGYGVVKLYDEDNAEYLEIIAVGGAGHLRTGGTTPGVLRFQNEIPQNIICWGALSSGNPSLYLYGWDSGASAVRYGRLNVDASGDFNIEAEEAMVLNAPSGISGTAIKDEDNMVSNSAVHLATQQSIKKYVDDQTASPSAHASTHEVGGGDLVDHDQLTNYAANQHVVLPGTIASVLTDHNLAAHTTLGLYDQDSDVDHNQTTNYAANQHRVWENSITENIHSGNITQASVTQHEAAIDHDNLLNTHNLTSDIDHDQLTNYAANQHIDWTNAANLFVDDYTTTLTSSLNLVDLDFTVNPSGSAATAVYGGLDIKLLAGTAQPISTLRGINALVWYSGSGIPNSLQGGNFGAVVDTGAANFGTIKGLWGSATVFAGAGTVYGVQGQAHVWGSDQTTVRGGRFRGQVATSDVYAVTASADVLEGLYSNVYAAGTASYACTIDTHMAGLYVDMEVAAYATVPLLYGIYIAAPVKAGTVTNHYGLYVASQAGIGSSVNWAMYLAGGDVFIQDDLQVDDITIDNPSSVYGLSHNSFADYAANQHVDHSGVSISAGGILTGGGTIEVTRTISLAQTDVDHGEISGLVDDDHSQYYNAARHTKVLHDSLSLEHGDLTGLGDDDHSQYLLIDGSRVMTGALTVQKAANNRLLVEDTGAGTTYPGIEIKHTDITWTVYIDGANDHLVWYDTAVRMCLDAVTGDLHLLTGNLFVDGVAKHIYIPNNSKLYVRNFADTSYIKLISLNVNDDTLINYAAGNELILQKGGTQIAKFDTGGFLFLSNMKSGATQVAATAAADEFWKTSGHATLPDNVLMIGV